jgi:hypothetical protein
MIDFDWMPLELDIHHMPPHIPSSSYHPAAAQVDADKNKKDLTSKGDDRPVHLLAKMAKKSSQAICWLIRGKKGDKNSRYRDRIRGEKFRVMTDVSDEPIGFVDVGKNNLSLQP